MDSAATADELTIGSTALDILVGDSSLDGLTDTLEILVTLVEMGESDGGGVTEGVTEVVAGGVLVEDDTVVTVN